MSNSTADNQIHLTDRFIAHLQKLLAKEDNPDQLFRVAIKGGGCAGFEYEPFRFELEQGEDDTLFGRDGVYVVIDNVSLSMLNGATLDFIEDLGGSRIHIDNPNATSGCGCGTSFSL